MEIKSYTDDTNVIVSGHSIKNALDKRGSAVRKDVEMIGGTVVPPRSDWHRDDFGVPLADAFALLHKYADGTGWRRSKRHLLSTLAGSLIETFGGENAADKDRELAVRFIGATGESASEKSEKVQPAKDKNARPKMPENAPLINAPSENVPPKNAPVPQKSKRQLRRENIRAVKKSGGSFLTENSMRKPVNPNVEIYGLKVGGLLIFPMWLLWFVWQFLLALEEFVRTQQFMFLILSVLVYRQSLNLATAFTRYADRGAGQLLAVGENVTLNAFIFGFGFEIIAVAAAYNRGDKGLIQVLTTFSILINLYKFDILRTDLALPEYFVGAVLSAMFPAAIYIVLETVIRRQKEYDES